MIPNPFDYYQPATLQEAQDAYAQLAARKREPLYYAGGSEILTMARVGSIRPGAVIDLKAIPECQEMGVKGDKLVIGACASLSRIAEARDFPLLATTVSRIADHTNQVRITLGGNLCGTIVYREAVLPLLLADCRVTIQGPKGQRKASIHECFDQRMRLEPGEFVVNCIIDNQYRNLPYVHAKRTKDEKIDYPLITLAATKGQEGIRAAFSGLCSYPFRSRELEKLLNGDMTPQEKAQAIAVHLPEEPMTNLLGSSVFRVYVLKDMIANMLDRLGGM